MSAWKAVVEMPGLHAPVRAWTRLLPKGRVAVDAGANAGIYTYWLARISRRVHAFEPIPSLATRLKSAQFQKVTVHEVALSDRNGVARLHLPTGSPVSRASLSRPRGQHEGFMVETRTLDSYNLKDVGTIKIDVEGVEHSVLKGAHRTITNCRPVIFCELEERHRTGAVHETVRYVRSVLRYNHVFYWRAGHIHAYSQFDLARDQIAQLPNDHSADYVNNFFFFP